MGKVTQLFSERREVLDKETGEVTAQESYRITRHESEPEYIKVYINAVGGIEDLTKAQAALLYEVSLLIHYDGSIQLTALQKRRIMERLNIAEKTFRNYMTTLVEKELLIRHTPTDYEANPHYFARGSWKEIIQKRSDFEMKIRFSQGKQPEVSTREIDDD